MIDVRHHSSTVASRSPASSTRRRRPFVAETAAAAPAGGASTATGRTLAPPPPATAALLCCARWHLCSALRPPAVPLLARGPPPLPRPSIMAALGSGCAHLAPATTRGSGAPAPRRAYMRCSPQQRSPPCSFVCARLLLHVPPTLVPLLGTLHEHAAPPGSAYTAAPSAHVVVITVAAPLVDHRR